jgi:hypothetical protein
MLYSFQPLVYAHSTLQLCSYNTTAVQRYSSAIDISTSPTGQPNTRPRHILWAADPSQWYAVLNDILELLQRRFHHLALEGPTGDGIARDTPLAQMTGQYPAHMM